MFLTAVRASFLVLRYQEVKGDTCGTHILIWRQNCLVETAIQTRLLLGSLLVFTGFYSVFYILNHVGSYGRKSTYCFYGTNHEEGAAEQADLKRLEFLMIAKKKGHVKLGKGFTYKYFDHFLTKQPQKAPRTPPISHLQPSCWNTQQCKRHLHWFHYLTPSSEQQDEEPDWKPQRPGRLSVVPGETRHCVGLSGSIVPAV